MSFFAVFDSLPLENAAETTKYCKKQLFHTTFKRKKLSDIFCGYEKGSRCPALSGVCKLLFALLFSSSVLVNELPLSLSWSLRNPTALAIGLPPLAKMKTASPSFGASMHLLNNGEIGKTYHSIFKDENTCILTLLLS